MYKIYKIVDNTNDNIYIGITTQTLKKRLGQHKSSTCCVSRDIIKNNDYRIELIEETDDKTRERYWILNTNCINITTPGRTKEEWYKENKEKITEKNKKYREKNKEKKTQYDKKYRENNKDKQKDHNRIRCKWNSSMGGEPRKNNMSLLKIDVNLFS
tara:strand:- start:850 stop:1320 length:471 start_codon:yes stop_codon:yes gene_type:complete